MKPHLLLALAATAVVLIAVFVLPGFEVRTEYASICQHTGSRYGYTKWFFGGKTGRWHETSPLEEFMEKNHPGRLKHKWISYAGTGKNILGRSISYGCGFPGPIIDMIYMNNAFLRASLAKMSDEEKLRLYELFSSENESDAQLAIERIFAAVSGLPLPTTTTFTPNPTNFE